MIAIIMLVLLIVLSCCKVSGDCSRQEEERYPCEFCMRREACDGCTRRNEDG